MKKLFKYLGIAVAVVVVVLIALMVIGLQGEKKDLEGLGRLQQESAEYFKTNGDFKNFCSSDLYQDISSNFSYDISCKADIENDGNGVQIIAHLVSDYYACKVANFPPESPGDDVKKQIACIKVPPEMGKLMQ
jgi:uncharacterized protein YpmS